jgi:ATP-dependent helicase/nuclease subunit B
MILSKENIQSVNTDYLLNEKINVGQFNTFLLVVPTNRKLRELKKRIISKAPNSTVTKINIETFGTLTKKLLLNNKSFHDLSDEAASIFIEKSVKSVPLVYLNNYSRNIPVGTLTKIKNVISKYKEEGITPEILLKESETLLRSEKKKAIDIARIYEHYQNNCEQINAYELGDIYSDLLKMKKEEFDNNFKALFPHVDLIIFDGFDSFSSLELGLLNKFSFLSSTLQYLNFDYYSYNPILFSHLEETYKKLQKFGFNKIADDFEINPNKFIEIVRKRLFLKSKNKIEDRFTNSITKITAPSREKEVQVIAKEIKSLLLAGTQPHEISVTFNLISNYSALVRDTFAAYGIPYNLTDRLKLENSLSVLAIISFMEILNSDFYYKNIIRAFSNSFIHIDGFDLDSLLFSATNLKIVVGRENWKYTLKQGIVFEENLRGLSKSNKRITKYKKALSSLEILDELLLPFGKEMKPLEFFAELNKLTHKLNIPKSILASSSEYKEVEIKALTTLLDASNEILELIEKENQNQKYHLDYYLEKLTTISTSTRFNIKERSDYGVLITNINELRGLSFNYCFIGGLIDGDFPTKYRPEIFFSGSFMKKDQQHSDEERFHFYQALSSWEKGLYLTLPVGDDFTPSTFLKDFEKSFKIKTKTHTDYDSLIYSNEEAERNIELDSEIFPLTSIQNKWIKEREIVQNRNLNPLANSPYSGFILAEGESFYENSKFNETAYSISQLESYTQCPFKYFLERILKIEINDEPDEDVEAIEIGSLLHTIVYKFYVELGKKNIKLQECSEVVFEHAEKMLFSIAKDEVENLFSNSPFAFYEEEKIFGINGDRQHSILYKFLQYERTNYDKIIPKYFETNFGVEDIEQDKVLSNTTPLMLDDIALRGKIDRIDVDEFTKTFEVIDYKTGGKKISSTEIEDGLSLQLPIYVWAAKTLLLEKSKENFQSESMAIYSLKYADENFGKNKVSLSRKKNGVDFTALLNEYVDIALTHVKESVAGIRKGEFPLTRFIENNEKVCKYCNYKMICRIDSIKN